MAKVAFSCLLLMLVAWTMHTPKVKCIAAGMWFQAHTQDPKNFEVGPTRSRRDEMKKKRGRETKNFVFFLWHRQKRGKFLQMKKRQTSPFSGWLLPKSAAEGPYYKTSILQSALSQTNYAVDHAEMEGLREFFIPTWGVENYHTVFTVSFSL